MESPPEHGRRRLTPETIASYWKVVVPILAFFFGCYIVFNDIVLDPPIDGLTSFVGVAIAGFGPALRDLLGKGA